MGGSSFSSLRKVGLRLESYPALQRSTSQEACEREKRKHDLEKTKKYYTPPSYEREKTYEGDAFCPSSLQAKQEVIGKVSKTLVIQ